jgi:hypothetical protein
MGNMMGHLEVQSGLCYLVIFPLNVFLMDTVKRFILSKPPGRRLINADFHIIMASVGQVAVCTLQIMYFLQLELKVHIGALFMLTMGRLAWGPLPYAATVFAVETIKLLTSLVCGVSNATALVTTALIVNFK